MSNVINIVDERATWAFIVDIKKRWEYSENV